MSVVYLSFYGTFLGSVLQVYILHKLNNPRVTRPWCTRRCSHAVLLASHPLDVTGWVANPLLGADVVFLMLHLKFNLLCFKLVITLRSIFLTLVCFSGTLSGHEYNSTQFFRIFIYYIHCLNLCDYRYLLGYATPRIYFSLSALSSRWYAVMMSVLFDIWCFLR